MNNMRLNTQGFSDTFYPIFEKGMDFVSGLGRYSAQLIKDIPQSIKNHPQAAYGAVAIVANQFFFIGIHSLANRLENGQDTKPESTGKRIFKSLFVNGVVVGGFSGLFNLALSNVVPLSRPFIGIITVSIVAFRIFLKLSTNSSPKAPEVPTKNPSNNPSNPPQITEDQLKEKEARLSNLQQTLDKRESELLTREDNLRKKENPSTMDRFDEIEALKKDALIFFRRLYKKKFKKELSVLANEKNKTSEIYLRHQGEARKYWEKINTIELQIKRNREQSAIPVAPELDSNAPPPPPPDGDSSSSLGTAPALNSKKIERFFEDEPEHEPIVPKNPTGQDVTTFSKNFEQIKKYVEKLKKAINPIFKVIDEVDSINIELCNQKDELRIQKKLLEERQEKLTAVDSLGKEEVEEEVIVIKDKREVFDKDGRRFKITKIDSLGKVEVEEEVIVITDKQEVLDNGGRFKIKKKITKENELDLEDNEKYKIDFTVFSDEAVTDISEARALINQAELGQMKKETNHLKNDKNLLQQKNFYKWFGFLVNSSNKKIEGINKKINNLNTKLAVVQAMENNGIKFKEFNEIVLPKRKRISDWEVILKKYESHNTALNKKDEVISETTPTQKKPKEKLEEPKEKLEGSGKKSSGEILRIMDQVYKIYPKLEKWFKNFSNPDNDFAVAFSGKLRNYATINEENVELLDRLKLKRKILTK